MVKNLNKFRYDINALRGIAVLGVIFFHFKIPHFNGGFSGVDIFFVISGYLMTSIIIRGVDKENFALREFYSKRLKRIVPALLFLITAITILGFFFYFPIDFMLNEKNAAASLLFLSNIYYWTNSGYFDASSETNILLHTWSLSVEWQFYLLYPLALLLLNKIIKNRLYFAIFFSVSTILMMVLSFLFTKWIPAASFYLLPSRAWEMMFGGIAFFMSDYLKNTGVRKSLSIVGYISLLISMFFLRSEMAWPGIYTIIPVSCTFIIIVANYNEFETLKNRTVQFFGKISYSLYLWHWPVFVFAKYFGAESTFISIITLMTICVLLGYLSYRYIESIDFQNNRFILTTMTSLTVITICLGLIVTNSSMFKPNSIYLTNYASKNVNKKIQFSAGCCFLTSLSSRIDRFKNTECLKIKGDMNNILLIGDSHAAQLSLSLKNILRKDGINLLQATSSGCSPVKRSNGQLRCSEVMDYVYNDFILHNSKKIDAIFICANWLGKGRMYDNQMIMDIKYTVKYLDKLNIPVILIGQNETFKMPYTSILAKEEEYNMKLLTDQLDLESYEVNDLMKKHFGSNYVDIINRNDFPRFSKAVGPYMFDNNHFTKYGADLAVDKIFSNLITQKLIAGINSKNRS